MKRLSLAFSLALLLASPCWSHGGVYRPPWGGPGDGPGPSKGGGGSGPAGPGATSPSTPSGPSGPSGPGPVAPITPKSPFPLAPTTAGPDEIPDPALWQVWWSYNHDAFLDLRARIHGLATTSPENLAMAERRKLQALLVPAFLETIEKGDKEVVLRQTLLALARLARVRTLGVPLERLTSLYLGRDYPNLQEAALLALGIGGDPASIQLLRHVLMDDARGRELLAQSGPVPTRMRAFAAYALGLLGRRDPSEDARRQVVHALLFALGQEGAVEREVRIACTLALGQVPIAPCETAEQALDPVRQIEELHLCGGAQTEYLLAIARDPELDPWFRGHAAAALGRLAASAGPGFPVTEDHPAIPSRADLVRALLQLAKDARGSLAVLHGCLLGLGWAVDSGGETVDAQARAFLAESTKRGGPMAQRFALVSLASALGRPGSGDEPDAAWQDGSAQLLRELSRAKNATLSWTALALAVAGHGRMAQRQAFPDAHVAALRMRLSQAKKADEAAACALALAVLRPDDVETAATLLEAFEEHASPLFRTYGALALGLLGVEDATALLEKALDASATSLPDAIAASVGLRLLGDADVVPDLVKRLADAKKPGEAFPLVNTLAFLQDPSAGAALLELVDDEERDVDVRAAILWCLGTLADPDAPDWTATYANGLDYNFLPWTLRSPLEDGRGLLDWR